MKKRAIFGGTFNPPHWGHLLIAETALNQAMLDQVIWVPTRFPAYKSDRNLAAFSHRLEMVQRSIASHPQFTLSAGEAHAQPPSYAVDTLQSLQALYPQTQWYWVIGLDSFRSLPRWYGHQTLAAACHWLVAPRPGAIEGWGDQNPATSVVQPDSCPVGSPPSAPSSNPMLCEQVAQQCATESISLQWQLLEMPSFSISSSLVRQYCHDRRSIRYLVPEAVRTYIIQHQLYLA